MGYFGKNNQVAPMTENDQPPKAIRHKVKKRKSKKGKSMWNAFTSFFAGLICFKASSSENKLFKNSVAPTSMYGNCPADSSDEEEEEESTTPPPPPKRRARFQEVQLKMAPAAEELVVEDIEDYEGDARTTTPVEPKEEKTEDTPAPVPAPVPPARLTVAITDLPKPNEYSETRDPRSTAEIIQDFRQSGLVGDLVSQEVKPNGLCYEIRIDTCTVRPKTAKGVRMHKPPRRLERIELEPSVEEEQLELLREKILEKQQRAALKRQEMKASQLRKQNTESQKQRKAVRFVAQANDQKKLEAAQKIACKAERVKSARLSQQEDRQRKIQMQSERHQKAVEFVAAVEEQKKKDAAKKIAVKAERVKSARECSDLRRSHRAAAKTRHGDGVRRRREHQDGPEIEYDKISTYNGSNENSRSTTPVGNSAAVGSGDESSPRQHHNNAQSSLVPERNENHDDFFDGPIGGGPDN